MTRPAVPQRRRGRRAGEAGTPIGLGSATVLLLLGACAAHPPASPTIAADASLYTVTVVQDAIASHAFTLANPGDASLVIGKV